MKNQIFISGENRRKETNSWQSVDNSLYFKANDDKLNFDNTDNLGYANDNYSGGLLFLGLSLRKKGAPFTEFLSC
ncbi:MAG: hypothetical protein WC650_00850 [Candidatus Doudnabacteria bacterium]